MTGRGVYYEGGGAFALREAPPVPPGPGEVRLDVAYCGICGTDLHIAHGGMDHRVRVPQVIGHEMSGTVAELGPDVVDVAVGDRVVVRPLDTRGETPADKGVSHISRNLKFLGIDTPGAFQSSWTVPAFTLHRLPDRVEHVAGRPGGAGANVVFEVSGSPAGALAMTELACLRGRIVVVAIYPEPQPVRLFDLFWKELQLRGARVYEPDDYERAIELLATDELPLEPLISRVEPLERLPQLFA